MSVAAVREALVNRPLTYAKLCWGTYRKHWKALTLPLIGVAVLAQFVRLDINVSPSLPHHVSLTFKFWKPETYQRGDLVVFKWHGGGGVPAGTPFVKVIGAVPGDRVFMTADGTFYRAYTGEAEKLPGAEGHFLARAKSRSLKGLRLEPGPVGVLPPHRYFVLGTHKDSLDSRYQLTGWLTDEEILGKTIALF